MLELAVCACFTLLPDYLFRRYVQGKRIGQEINFFTMWYELRWGIVTCLMATITIITLVFYYHPSTQAVSSYFRTVTILPETPGRVTEVYVTNNQEVAAGDPIFRLDSTSQDAAVVSAQRRVEEVNAQLAVSGAQVASAQATVDQATAARDLIKEDFDRNNELLERGSPAANQAEVDRLANRLAEREAQLEAARANLEAVRENIEIVLPAQRASAEASLRQAEAELAKTLVVAGVSGRVEQFSLQVGDYVSAILRPAGILVPSGSGQARFQAGFNQLASGVLKPGMIAEIGCMPRPFTIVPMVIVAVQDVIPSGQFRPSDQLLDPQNNMRPGSIIAFLEPLYEGGIDDLPPGSNCLGTAYTNHHDLLVQGDLNLGTSIFYHVVDTIGVVHAAGLRLRMLLLPVTSLVLSGH